MPRAVKTKPPDQQNVPAFQRKRSLAAKGRRKRKPATALERKEAGVPVVKPKRVRRTYRRRTVAGSATRRATAGRISLSDSDLSTSDVYERRERLKAKLAAEREAGYGSSVRTFSMSSSSSGGGFASLSAAESRIKGVSLPIVDDYEPYAASEEPYAEVREMQLCGVVEDFFDRVSLAVVRLEAGVRVGDKLIFETQDGLFEQEVETMQIDQSDVMTAYAGDDVGIKVQRKPKKGGNVYKVLT